ncbi:MAG: heme o synthase [Chloroflexi bacterium]|nr:heme o synthase [Chloroflexota bacterium]MDA1219672.1 heme o synthase [Chloroflexota bacterium]PKB57494.1 MAG: protoheme IX farnesyltransferase [SAR202 cluster bacterium Casp-Chloro-G3]
MTNLQSAVEGIPGRSASLLAILNDYLTLTKPPIVVLLLITAAGGMFLAAQGLPSLMLMGLVWLGGALAAGGANAINHYLDRDIDERMSRTRQRPVPGNRITPNKALTFGIALNVVAFAILGIGVNLLAALLTLSATLFYVFVYTNWLKRTTPQNIVIGGAAGAIPPLVGWAAVTGGLDLPAVYLFAIVFFWTPPHFWALSLLIKDDYAEAGIPMLPVVTTVEHTTLQIFYYTLALVGLTIMFALSTAVGLVYLGSALVMGVVFIAMAWRLKRNYSRSGAKNVYLYSLLYLALLFVAVMVDSIIQL